MIVHSSTYRRTRNRLTSVPPIICACLVFLPLVGRLISVLSCTDAEYGTCQAAEKRAYLSQVYIDTTIGKAMYVLIEAAHRPGFGHLREDAIQEAKRVAEELKLASKKDPNRAYVLTKLADLEQQIYFEEKELEEKKQQERIKLLNHLVGQFNTETAKPRPDFNTLFTILEQMQNVNARKADQIEALIEERARNVAREVVYYIQAALDRSDLDKARRELDYVYKNMQPLGMSLTDYSVFAAKVQARVSLKDEQAFLASDAKEAERLLNESKLGGAADALSRIEKRLVRIKDRISDGECKSYTAKINRFSSILHAREDSLVNVNLQLLQTRGIDTALTFMDYIQRYFGVSREKIMVVDHEILLGLLATRTQKDTVISREVAELTAESNQSFGTEDILRAAQKKAQVRADSIRAAEEQARLEEERRNRSTFQRWRTARDDLRKADLEKAEQQRRADAQKRDDPKKAALEKAEQQRRAEAQKRDDQKTADLQKAEQQRRAEAQKRENQKMGALEKAEQQRRAEVQKRPAMAEQQKNVSDPAPAPIKQEPTPAPVAVAPPPSSASAAAEPDPVYSGESSKEQDLANQYVVDIYTLLEQKKTKDAYLAFCRLRPEMEKYVSKEAIGMLEACINQAYSALAKKR